MRTIRGNEAITYSSLQCEDSSLLEKKFWLTKKPEKRGRIFPWGGGGSPVLSISRSHEPISLYREKEKWKERLLEWRSCSSGFPLPTYLRISFRENGGCQEER